ncbi:DUF4388 domain-containing protein [Chloroflexus sp. Y-396-1]|uniref:DUF4388 domain-containing protein n=1 Tax=Chloroflexus sp. Y-396-1 TaxID=867845 RepID=UPI00048C1341|nr:DUF4388 domain-containing protein [Chloroflexus sp. Y-396-1]
MALVGNIRDFSLSDFLSLVDRGYKTGALHLSYNDQMARLYFEKGKLLLAARRPEDEKPELLVRLGVLNADQVAQACRVLAERGNGVTLSQVLIDSGLVSADRLQQALMSHTEQSVYGLFAWPEGDFLFEHNQRPAPDAPLAPTPISIDHLIMEGVRRIDEWERIRDRIPSTDLVPRFLAPPGEKLKGMRLAPDEWKVFARINGRDTLAEIAQKTGLSDFDVCRAVYGFLTAGMLELVKRQRVLAAGMPPVEQPRLKKSLVNRIINRIRSM